MQVLYIPIYLILLVFEYYNGKYAFCFGDIKFKIDVIIERFWFNNKSKE